MEILEEVMDEDKELYTISHIINPNKKKQTKHQVPILLGNVNGRLVKAKYHTLMILLDSGANSSIVIGKHTHKLRHKKTHTVKWSTQGSDFLTDYKTNVELVLPELDMTKIVTWSFHVVTCRKNQGMK